MKRDQLTNDAGAPLRRGADHLAPPKRKREVAPGSLDPTQPMSGAARGPMRSESSVIEVGVGVGVEEEQAAESAEVPEDDSPFSSTAPPGALPDPMPQPLPPSLLQAAPVPPPERSHLEITAPQPAVVAAPPSPPDARPAEESAVVKLRHLLFAVLATLFVVAVTAAGTAYFLRYTMRPSSEFGGRDASAQRTRAKERAHTAQRDDDNDDEDADAPEPTTKRQLLEQTAPTAMITIPAGTFRMGSRDGSRDERPEHVESMHAFLIDPDEVTVADYEKCVAAGECRRQRTTHQPEGDRKFDRFCNYGRKNREQHPMNCVDWYQARAYCRYAGKRLPTESEWEYAARGENGLLYPWGNEGPSERQLNACGRECQILGEQIGKEWSAMYTADDGWDATAPAGKFPRDKSPFGVLDMAGNVAEWTDTLYAKCYRDDCEASGKERVIRGGSWNDDDPRSVRAAARSRDVPHLRASFVGFRCAKNSPEKAASRP